MLAQDYKIAFLFFLQITALLLIFYVAFHATAFRKWRAEASDEGQILLERKTYLLSGMLKAGILGYFFTLFWFLHLLNAHFPALIRGAMCADGVLRAGSFGAQILPLKFLILLLLSCLNFLNERDFLYSETPFTPKKFLFLLPLCAFTSYDLILSFHFVQSLQPDLLTNCCSASSFAPSSSEGAEMINFDISGEFYAIIFVFFLIFLLFALFLGKKFWLFAAEISYSIMGFLSLSHFFTGYIYENFSHDCLFDLFLPENNYLGYIIFLGYFFILSDALQNIIPYFYKKKEMYFEKTSRQTKFLLFFAFLLTQIPTVVYLISDLRK